MPTAPSYQHFKGESGIVEVTAEGAEDLTDWKENILILQSLQTYWLCKDNFKAHRRVLKGVYISVFYFDFTSEFIQYFKHIIGHFTYVSLYSLNQSWDFGSILILQITNHKSQLSYMISKILQAASDETRI